jgi:hypothetical protein
MKVDKYAGREVIYDKFGGILCGVEMSGGLYIPDNEWTRDELRELLPHLAAWCETGSLEVSDER